MNIGSQVVSKLGSPNSKVPLAIKDVFNSAGYTYFSYDAGGDIEAKDRLVDEVGTGALWLFGIPGYKKLIDKTVFKKAGISPDVDVRVIKDKDYIKKAIENAPTNEICKEIETAGKNAGKTKALTLLKFAMALGLTMASYFGLTKFKQNMTKKNIEKEFLKKQTNNENKEDISPYKNTNPIFSEFTNVSNNNPSFGSSAIIKSAENFILNPVKNMMVLDACISGERLSHSRTKGEFTEYGIKEGSFLFFVYGADKFIKKGIEKCSQKLFKAPIKLDANFLLSDLSEKILSDKSLQEEINNFGKNLSSKTDTASLYDYIFKNQNNTVIEAAKKSGIISTVKDKAGNTKIDTRKYIDPKEIKSLVKDLQDFAANSKSSKDIKSYLNKIKALKVGSTILNIGICCFFLGFVVPKMMYKYRNNHQDGSKEFHVKTEYEKELAKKSETQL
ncbi:MAG: hypothetical protein LUH05_01065 [Candidatus Gastranaerophilales bacterium]|nr:hypothetical protein [Candidatus Gastranaerophilales bacterium]